ncbi:MAG TPA: GNAT family N-acetyltransferase [Acidimicrobiia bacterium]
MDLVIAIDDPRADDVRTLLDRHLAFAREVTPSDHVHAMEADDLLGPAVTFFSARRDGLLLGVGALKRLDETHAELKSMHTSEDARGQGVGRAMVDHLLAVAADRNSRRVSLETGTMDAFAPARSLYTSAGFRPCAPFGEYTANPHSACMTIDLSETADGRRQTRAEESCQEPDDTIACRRLDGPGGKR